MKQNEHPTCQDDIIAHVRHRLEQASRRDARRAIPITTLTYAQSVDGCIATAQGGPLQLSNQASLRLTHRVRALHDAILVGINTVLLDNPRLTVRLVPGASPQPIIVDTQLRFPLDAKLIKNTCHPPIIAAAKSACRDKERRLTAMGARVIHVSQQDDGLLDLSELFCRLRKLDLQTIMVEGGARIITSVLAEQLADQLLLTISPRYVGGLQAINPPLRSRVDRLPCLSNLHYQALDGDLILRGDLDHDQKRRTSVAACPSTSCATGEDQA